MFSRRNFLVGFTSSIVGLTMVPFRNTALGMTMSSTERDAEMISLMKEVISADRIMKENWNQKYGFERITVDDYLNSEDLGLCVESQINWLNFINKNYDPSKTTKSEIDGLFQNKFSIIDESDSTILRLQEGSIPVASMREILARNKIRICSSTAINVPLTEFTKNYGDLIIN